MANEIQEVLEKDPLKLADKDIDVIINYMRKMRAQADAGIKPKKDDDGKKINLAAIGLKKKIVNDLGDL